MKGFMRLEFIGMILAVSLLICFVVLMYGIARKINYNISYERMVVETICEKVDHRYLKEGACDD